MDGHTRVTSAQILGYTEIPAFFHVFEDEDEALEYAIHNQRDRRNLTDADMLRCLEIMDKRKAAGRPEKLAQSCANSGKSAEETAEVLGISPRKVEQARTVLDHADVAIKQAVLSGEKSINKAYNEVQQQRRENPPPAPNRPTVTFEPLPDHTFAGVTPLVASSDSKAAPSSH